MHPNQALQMTEKNIGIVIDVLRKGGTQEEAARSIGVSAQCITDWKQKALSDNITNPVLYPLHDYFIARDRKNIGNSLAPFREELEMALLKAALDGQKTVTTKTTTFASISKRDYEKLNAEDKRTITDWIEDVDRVLVRVDKTEKHQSPDPKFVDKIIERFFGDLSHIC